MDTDKYKKQVKLILEQAGACAPRKVVSLIREINPTGKSLPRFVEQELYRLKSDLQSRLIIDYPEEVEFRRDKLSANVGGVDGDENVILLFYKPLQLEACHALISELQGEARFIALKALDQGDNAQSSAIASEELGKRLLSDHQHFPSGKKRELRYKPSPKSFDDETLDFESLRQQAQEAIENYNYEEAKNLYLWGFSQCGGEPSMALPLFELLVETLGSWQDVIALEPKLSVKSRNHEAIQLFVAQAYQECGDVSKAEEFLRGVQNPQAAFIYGKLAQQKMVMSDLDEAQRLLSLAQNLAQGGYLQECAELNQRLYQLNLDKVKNQATEMQELLAKGDIDEALSKANLLLERVPNHPEAKTLIEQVNALKQNQKKAELLRAVESAKRANEHERELKAIEQLLDQQQWFIDGDAEKIRLEERLNELRGLHLKERVQQLDRIIEEALTADNLERALYIFLEAEEAIQKQLVEVRQSPFLVLARELVQSVKHSRHSEIRQSLIQVYRLQQRAENELGVASTHHERNIQRILENLKSHSNLVGALPSLSSWVSQLESQFQSLTEERWWQAIENLRSHVRKGEFKQAEELWATLDGSRVPLAVKEKWTALERELQEYREGVSLEQKFKEFLDSNQYLEARQCAENLLVRADNKVQKEVWKKYISKLQKNLNEQWGLKQYLNPVVDKLIINSLFRNAASELICGVHPNGHEAIVPCGAGPSLFLFVFSTESQALQEVITLNCPAEATHIDIMHEGDRICLICGNKKILWLNRATWDILNAITVSAAITGGRTLEQIDLQPYGTLAWLSLSGHGPFRTEGEETLVYDLSTSSVIRRRPLTLAALQVMEGADTKLLLSRNGNLQLIDFQGRLLDSVAFGDKEIVTCVGRRPNHKGLFIGHYFDSYSSEIEQEDGYFTVSLWQGNEIKSLGTLEEVSAVFKHDFITFDGFDGFLLGHRVSENYQLKAIKLGKSDQLETLWTQDLAAAPLFITDLFCKRSFVIETRGHTLAVMPLTTELPPLKMKKSFHKLPPLNDRYEPCRRFRGPLRARLLAIGAMIKELKTAEDIQQFLKRQMAQSGDNVDELYTLYLALKDSLKFMSMPAHNHPSRRVWIALIERFPDASYVKFECSLKALAENDLSTAIEHLAAIHCESLESTDQIHYYHVYGNTLALLNDFDGAFSLWQKGRALQVALYKKGIHSDESALSTIEDDEDSELGGCPLDKLLDLFEFSKQPVLGDQENQDETSMSPEKFSRQQAVVSFLRHIYSADQALAQGDFVRAFEVYQKMDLPEVIPLQVAARWTRVLLELAKQQQSLMNPLNFELQLLFHCQHFLGVSDLSRDSLVERERAQPLPPPLRNWSETELEQLVHDCAEWLARWRSNLSSPSEF